MARQPVLFIQGAADMWAPDGSGVLARYMEKSLGADFDVVAPEMPDAETDPHYGPWRDEIDARLHGRTAPSSSLGTRSAAPCC